MKLFSLFGGLVAASEKVDYSGSKVLRLDNEIFYKTQGMNQAVWFILFFNDSFLYKSLKYIKRAKKQALLFLNFILESPLKMNPCSSSSRP